MATLLRLAREKCEMAFAQWILSKKSGALLAPVDVPVLVRRGKFLNGALVLENPDEITRPSIVVSCPRVVPHIMGYPVCELHVLTLNSTDEDNARELQPGRFGLVSDMFNDVDIDQDQYDALLAFMRKPPAGPDNRLVKDFTVFGYAQSEEMGEETETTWIDHLVYEVHCIPTDDLDGDGED